MGVASRPLPDRLMQYRWKPGEAPKGVNPWIGRANQVREDLWQAAPKPVREQMAKQVIELALGIALEPAFHDGAPVLCPDGSPKMAPLPPERRARMMVWALDTWYKCMGGTLTFKSIEASVRVDVADRAEQAREITRTLLDVGMGHLVTPAMRALIDAEQPALPAPPDPSA